MTASTGGNVSEPMPADDPRLIAWKKYQETEEYSNTTKWALDTNASDDQRQLYVEGSLWAAFIQGYEDGGIAWPGQ